MNKYLYIAANLLIALYIAFILTKVAIYKQAVFVRTYHLESHFYADYPQEEN